MLQMLERRRKYGGVILLGWCYFVKRTYSITLQRKEIRVQNFWDLSGITLYLKLKINFYRSSVPLNIISTRVNNEDT